MKKRAVLYARSAVNENDAIARQIEKCRLFAIKHEYSIVAQYSDVGSGCAPNLPQRTEALTTAESNQAILICTDPTRPARDMSILERFIADCKQSNIAIIFIEGD